MIINEQLPSMKVLDDGEQYVMMQCGVCKKITAVASDYLEAREAFVQYAGWHHLRNHQ